MKKTILSVCLILVLTIGGYVLYSYFAVSPPASPFVPMRAFKKLHEFATGLPNGEVFLNVTGNRVDAKIIYTNELAEQEDTRKIASSVTPKGDSLIKKVLMEDALYFTDIEFVCRHRASVEDLPSIRVYFRLQPDGTFLEWNPLAWGSK